MLVFREAWHQWIRLCSMLVFREETC
jgi:Fe-S cluster biosynthesis and repair protein YggX